MPYITQTFEHGLRTYRYLSIILADFWFFFFLHFVRLFLIISSKIWLLKQIHLFLNVQLPKTQVKLELGVHLLIQYGFTVVRHVRPIEKIIIERDLGLIQAATIQQLEQLYFWAESSGQTEDIDTQVFQKHLNQDTIDEALVSWLLYEPSLPNG
jgi:hypothetical protein